MRGIVNLLIVILITYTLNAVPINNTMLSFDLIKPWDHLQTLPVEDEQSEGLNYPVIEFLPTEENALENPETISVTFSSSKDLSNDEIEYLLDKFSIEIFDYQQTSMLPLSLVSPEDKAIQINETTADNTWHYGLTLDLSSDTMNKFIGDYKVSLVGADSLWGLDERLTFDVHYTPSFNYSPALSKVDTNQIYTQVYYLNASKEFLVPVSKELTSSSKFIRNTINTLSYEIPTDTQLFAQDVSFPRLPRVYLNNGLLSCYLDDAEVTRFEAGTPVNKLLSEALVKSLTDIAYVDNMTFYVNDRQNGNFINGLPLKTIYNEDFNTYAYLNYYDGQAYSYLVPQVVSDGEETVEDLINILKTRYEPIGNGGFVVATLPSIVNLMDNTQNGSQLTLTFSDTLYTAYADSLTIQQMMMDSIIQSMTSLPSVEQVIILTESHKSGTIGTVSLGEAYAANRFLNPISQ